MNQKTNISNETEFRHEYPVAIEFPVHWGEMDAFRHVNNVTYFRYFESARIAYFEQTHIMAEMQEKQIGPILASTEARFKRPLTFPDNLLVGCKTLELKEQEMTQEYAIFSLTQQAVTTVGYGRIVMVDYNSHQKVAVSPSIAEAILRLQPSLKP